MELYREALRLDGTSAEAHYNLALALGQLGRHAEKRAALEEAVALKPGLYQARNDLGLAYLAEGRLAEAREAFGKALELNPDFAEAANNLGFLLAQQGHSADAIALFRRAVALRPDYARAHLNHGLVLADQERFAEAEERIRKALSLAPDDAQIRISLGIALARQGRSAEAIETFRALADAQPDSAEAHLNLGIALADRYDLEGALASFSQAVRLSPGSAAARYNKGRALYDLGRRDEAAAELEMAAAAPEALYLLALIAKQRGEPERSRDLLARVVAAAPKHADAHYQLGLNYAQAGKAAAAAAQWKQAVAIDGDHPQALYNLARLLRASDPAEARRYQARFEEGQRRRRVTDRAETLGNFALASAEARDWPQAVAQLAEAIQVCGDCSSKATLHKNLGLVHARSGNLERAEASLRLALRLLPSDEDIARSLDLIASYNRRSAVR